MSRRVSCYCAFCRSPRMVYQRRHAGIVHGLMALALGLATTGVLFESLDPRGLALTIFYYLIAELVVQYRWRMSIICPHCAFDPVLYLRDTQKAVSIVKERLERRKTDPRVFLSSRPVLDIPVRVPQKSLMDKLNETPRATSSKVGLPSAKEKVVLSPSRERAKTGLSLNPDRENRTLVP